MFASATRRDGAARDGPGPERTIHDERHRRCARATGVPAPDRTGSRIFAVGQVFTGPPRTFGPDTAAAFAEISGDRGRPHTRARPHPGRAAAIHGPRLGEAGFGWQLMSSAF
ncbi:hypothetical protein HBB16_16000 [Pseudonocardia sp. MCCB 268]|nr:hypothetical protein [Pseudonocardia cytotoxica]